MKFRWELVRQATAIIVVFAFLIAAFGFGLTPVNAQNQTVKEKLFDKFKKADAITRAVRNKSNELVKVGINSLTDRAKADKLGAIVEDYGSFVVLAKNKAAKNAVSELQHQQLDTSINLPNGKFEPIVDSPAETITSKSNSAELSAGKNYYIVQVASIAKDEWLKSFEEIGAEVIQYVPHQAFFVYADGEAIAKLTNHSRVRWIGKYSAEQKISPELREFTKKAGRESDLAIFSIAVFKRSGLLETRNEILNSFRTEILDVIETPNNFFDVIRVKMPADYVEKIALLRDVVRIDEYVKPTVEDERAAQIVAGNFTGTMQLNPPGYNPFSQFGVDGTNVTVSVIDNGISIPGNGGYYLTSANTVDGPLRGGISSSENGHGQLVATIIAGTTPFGGSDPLGYNYGLGIAPKANIINIPAIRLSQPYQGNEVQFVDDTLNTTGPNGIRGSISNNSWGNGNFGNKYADYEALWDGFVQDSSIAATFDPLCIIFSAGNTGAVGLTRPKVAKNIIAVGSSENIRPEFTFPIYANTSTEIANNIDELAIDSSKGPAFDGRVKPDIIAPGHAITGSRAGNSAGFDANHNISGGTSFAAPQISGVAALFTQFWKNNNSGVNPSPAMIKAAILNTAQEMNGVNTSTSIPNGNEGWGRVNMKFMFNTGVPIKYVDQTVQFNNPGENIIYNGRVGDSTKPTRISLVWTDPPGVSDPALVNNLDLTVTVGGITYNGNVFTNGSSSSGGSADTKNNVENVFLPAGIPAGTPVTIRVSATALNGNGILGNADATDQHFSLVAYNYTEQQLPPVRRNKPSDFDGDGKADIGVFRQSSGSWFILRSSDSSFAAVQFGQNGDRIVPGDYDGDGKTDQAVFRDSVGVWYLQKSLQGFSGIQFGQSGDLPVAGDYDGDGKTDIAVYRPSTGTWFLLQSTAGFAAYQFGINSDKVVPADYDGDGKTDIAVFRPSNGVWYLLLSQVGFAGVSFGINGDIPAPADFDGDGKADIASFRGDFGIWFRLNSSNGSFNATQFGVNLDFPIEAGYVPVQ